MTWWRNAFCHPYVALTIVIVLHEVYCVSSSSSTSFWIGLEAISLSHEKSIPNTLLHHMSVDDVWSKDQQLRWNDLVCNKVSHRMDMLPLSCMDTIPTACRCQQRIFVWDCTTEMLQTARQTCHNVLDCPLPSDRINQ